MIIVIYLSEVITHKVFLIPYPVKYLASYKYTSLAPRYYGYG